MAELERLRGLLRRSDDLISLASHELKGPLHVMGMLCHLIETRTARAEPIDRATTERLRRQVARLNRIINQLLDATRAQEGRLQLELEPLDLAELVRERLRTVGDSRAADIQAELPKKAPLQADRARLVEVVHQLIGNATTFTEPGTPVRVSLRADGKDWVLTVADEGPGIAVADRTRLFERGVRRDPKLGAQGLLLGLYIAAHVARLHGGSLHFTPTEPRGATFTLRLPR